MMDDEEQIELMIEECLDLLDKGVQFTAWEQDFLESIEDVNDYEHLTDKQITKLTEIWERRCL